MPVHPSRVCNAARLSGDCSRFLAGCIELICEGMDAVYNDSVHSDAVYNVGVHSMLHLMLVYINLEFLSHHNSMSAPCAAGIPVWISWFKYLSFIFYGESARVVLLVFLHVGVASVWLLLCHETLTDYCCGSACNVKLLHKQPGDCYFCLLIGSLLDACASVLMHSDEPWSVSKLLYIDALFLPFRECNLQ